MKNKSLKIGFIGSVITALCCFTPLLVILLGAVGAAALVAYLDYVFFPLLALFPAMVVFGFFKRAKDA